MFYVSGNIISKSPMGFRVVSKVVTLNGIMANIMLDFNEFHTFWTITSKWLKLDLEHD